MKQTTSDKLGFVQFCTLILGRDFTFTLNDPVFWSFELNNYLTKYEIRGEYLLLYIYFQYKVILCAFSRFDMTVGLGFAFGVFCGTLSFLASPNFMFWNCWHCLVLLNFGPEHGLAIIRNVLKQRMYNFGRLWS